MSDAEHKKQPVEIRMLDMAAQENNDGEEGALLQEGAERISELETAITNYVNAKAEEQQHRPSSATHTGKGGYDSKEQERLHRIACDRLRDAWKALKGENDE